MTDRWVVVAALAMACVACKGNGKSGGPFEIKSEVKRETTKATGTPGAIGWGLIDAQPDLILANVTGPLGDAMRQTIEKSRYPKQGMLSLDGNLSPAKPGENGELHATFKVLAYFAHVPQMTKLEGTIRVHLRYKNASPAQLGESLGGAITSWLDGEKLPEKLGVPTGPVAKVTRIVAGPPSCSLHEDGSVRCWDVDMIEAVLIPDAADSIAIGSANNFGACGVKKNGKAWCLDAWNNTSAYEVREVCGVEGAVDVSVGQSTACALLGAGKVRCWPRDEKSFAPCAGGIASAEIIGLADAASVETGAFRSCAVKKDGRVACWEPCGNNCNGGIVGSFNPHFPPKPTQVKELANAKQVVYAFQPCAWVGDDHVVCAKHGDLEGSDTVVPEPIKELVRDRMGACALTTKGNLYCSSAGKPFEKQGPADLVEADGGIGGSCGVNSKNEVNCWGGLDGTLGLHDITMSY